MSGWGNEASLRHARMEGISRAGSAAAKLVGEVEQHGRDFSDPGRLVKALGLRVVEKDVELHVGVGVALAFGEGAVHQRRNDALVLLAKFADAGNKAFLNQRSHSISRP
jgi:hypothetical protein